MKYRKAGACSLAFLLTITALGFAHAQDFQSSDFLSDYSKLKQSSDKYMDYTYIAAACDPKRTLLLPIADRSCYGVLTT
jgi:hypothetical protein